EMAKQQSKHWHEQIVPHAPPTHLDTPQHRVEKAPTTPTVINQTTTITDFLNSFFAGACTRTVP
ncbi:MAG: hypothetical protein ACMV16_09745, partial [Macromonas sp.]